MNHTDPSKFYRYKQAFDLILKDSNVQIIVAEIDNNIIATAHISGRNPGN